MLSPNGHVVVALQAAWSAIHVTRHARDYLVGAPRQAVAISDDTDYFQELASGRPKVLLP